MLAFPPLFQVASSLLSSFSLCQHHTFPFHWTTSLNVDNVTNYFLPNTGISVWNEHSPKIESALAENNKVSTERICLMFLSHTISARRSLMDNKSLIISPRRRRRFHHFANPFGSEKTHSVYKEEKEIPRLKIIIFDVKSIFQWLMRFHFRIYI